MAYASEFQGYQADLEWNDAALRSQFYLGLKDAVKFELSRVKTPTLSAMINAAKETDERLQELRQDRRYYGFPREFRSKAKNDDPYGPMPMELDATDRGPDRPGGSQRDKKCYAFVVLGGVVGPPQEGATRSGVTDPP